MIYVFLANGFEETEAIAPIDIMRRAGLEVAVVGIDSNVVFSSHNISVNTDIRDFDVQTDNMEAIVLPGGMPGTLNLEKSDIVKASINYCMQNNLPVCAICAAPSILGHMGLLNGKKAVCFPGFEAELKGADVQNDLVCSDGNIITAKGAGAAVEFGLAIVSKLVGKSDADKIKKSIQCS